MALGTTIVKYALFFFNFLCFLGGIVLIIIGGVLYKSFDEYKSVYSTDDKPLLSINPAIAIIVFGAIIFVISFFGCCGAIKESNWMLLSYSGLLFVILLIEIAVCVYSIKVDSTDLKDKLNHGFAKSFELYNKDKVIEKLWDSMQQKLKCCGKTSYKDWSTVPTSCCRKKSEHCADNVNKEDEKQAEKVIYTKGCEAKILEVLEDKRGAYAGIAIGLIQLVGIIFAGCLAAKYRQKSNYRTY